MKIARQEPKVQPKFVLEGFLDLRTMQTSVIIEHLEHAMSLREMPIEMHARRKLLQ